MARVLTTATDFGEQNAEYIYIYKKKKQEHLKDLKKTEGRALPIWRVCQEEGRIK